MSNDSVGVEVGQ